MPILPGSHLSITVFMVWGLGHCPTCWGGEVPKLRLPLFEEVYSVEPRLYRDVESYISIDTHRVRV